MSKNQEKTKNVEIKEISTYSCGDSVVVVIGVDSVAGSVQTYIIYTLCKCFVSFVQRFVVFRQLQNMIFILTPKYQRCPHIYLFAIVHISSEKRPLY